MILLVYVLAGCTSGTEPLPPEGSSFQVDCLGMVPLQDGQQWGTPQILQSDAGIADGRRCEATIPRADITAWNEGPTQAAYPFRVRANGTRWSAMEDMTYQVDQAVGDFYARGSYSGTFINDDGERSWGTGYFDLCDPTQRLDCPYTIEGSTPYSFETSSRIVTAWGEGTDCRAVIDQATGALQVDLQSGVWNGTNITQLYRSTCPSREDSDPDWYRNRMTFRAGGVTGPGRCGPYKVTDFNGVQLPSLTWQAPPIFVGSSVRVAVDDAHLLCDDTQGPYTLQTLNWTAYEGGVDSRCTYEIVDGTPGSVWISCSHVRHDRLAPTEIECTHPEIGCNDSCDTAAGTCGHPFEWTGSCDVVYR